MHQREALCLCFLCDPDRVLRVEVRPPGAYLAGLQGTFRDEQVGSAGEADRVITDTGIRAVGDHLPVDFHTVPVTGGRVDKRAAFHGERELVHTLRKLDDVDGVRECCKGYGERFPGKGVEEGSATREAIDPHASLKPELDERVEPGDVVDVEMAEEQKDRLLLRDVPVGFGNPVARIEDDVELIGLDEDGDGVSRDGVEPAVGTKEGDLHGTEGCFWQDKKGCGGYNFPVVIDRVPL